MKNNEKLLKQFAKGKETTQKDTRGENCVIYTRVSSKEQADNNQSLEWQKKYCIDYAVKMNFKIQGYFGGTYESAKSDERKEFNRMLKFVKSSKEKISFILVYSLDRFSRTGDSAIYLASELKKTGVNILAVTQPIDTNSHAGALQQNIQFIFSKYDNDLRRQKSVDGMREKLRRGEWIGNTPTGYSYDHIRGREAQRIIINEKGAFIKQAFIWRSEGRTYDEIVEKLEKLGYKIPSQLLTDIFRNPFYCGMVSHNLLNGEIVKGNHPAMIDEDLFLKVNQFHKKSGYNIMKVNENLPLKVFVKEADTKIPFTGYIVKKKNKYYYKVNKIGIRINRSMVMMHEKFKDLLGEYSIDKIYIEAAKKQLLRSVEYFSESKADFKRSISKKINDVEEKIEKIEERHAFGEISLDIYTKFSSKLYDEKKQLMVELEKLNEKISNPKKVINFACELISKLSVAWENSPYHQKKRLQYLVFPEGLLYEGEIDQYRTPSVRVLFEKLASLSRSYVEKKEGSSDFDIKNSRSVARSGVEPESADWRI